MKVLCICPIGIGNYLLIYPACSLIKKHCPGMQLFLLGPRAAIKELAGPDPLWSGVISFDATATLKNPAAAAGIIGRLRREKFDASLSLFPGNKWHYNLLPVLAGIPRRYGFEYLYRPLSKLGFLQTHTSPVDPALHDVDQNRRLATLFTKKNLDAEPAVYPQLSSDDDRRWAEAFLAPSRGRRRLAVHPGSSNEHGMAAKRWPAERFAELAGRIARKLDARVYVFGGPDEASLKQTVQTGLKGAATIVDPVALGKTTALLAGCDLCLANDSGIMHMAACGGVPTIAIFGPTDARRNGPVGAASLVVRKEMPGFPLWTAANVGNRGVPPGVDPMASLLALSAEEAWQQIAPWLDANFTSSGSNC
jgi:ADP-heptose:LPS heptosyltransferase